MPNLVKSKADGGGGSESETRPLRVLLLAPSLDILGGQSRQCARLREGLKSESSLQVDFYPHNPRMPRGLRWLQRIKYVRTIVTTWLYVSWLLLSAWRYDI